MRRVTLGEFCERSIQISYINIIGKQQHILFTNFSSQFLYKNCHFSFLSQLKILLNLTRVRFSVSATYQCHFLVPTRNNPTVSISSSKKCSSNFFFFKWNIRAVSRTFGIVGEYDCMRITRCPLIKAGSSLFGEVGAGISAARFTKYSSNIAYFQTINRIEFWMKKNLIEVGLGSHYINSRRA